MSSIVFDLSTAEIVELSVRNAIERLGLLKPEAENYLIPLFLETIDKDQPSTGIFGTYFRKMGTQLSKEEKKGI